MSVLFPRTGHAGYADQHMEGILTTKFFRLCSAAPAMLTALCRFRSGGFRKGDGFFASQVAGGERSWIDEELLARRRAYDMATLFT